MTAHGDPLLVVAASQGKHIKWNLHQFHYLKKISKLTNHSNDIWNCTKFSYYSSDFLSEKAVDLLIKNGTNVNAANKYGTTALMAAAKKGNLKTASN